MASGSPSCMGFSNKAGTKAREIIEFKLQAGSLDLDLVLYSASISIRYYTEEWEISKKGRNEEL